MTAVTISRGARLYQILGPPCLFLASACPSAGIFFSFYLLLRGRKMCLNGPIFPILTIKGHRSQVNRKCAAKMAEFLDDWRDLSSAHAKKFAHNPRKRSGLSEKTIDAVAKNKSSILIYRENPNFASVTQAIKVGQIALSFRTLHVFSSACSFFEARLGLITRAKISENAFQNKENDSYGTGHLSLYYI